MSLLLSSVAGQPDPDIVIVPYVFAAFGLGLDYLFMPVYALALAFGTLLAAERHGGWLSPSARWRDTKLIVQSRTHDGFLTFVQVA